MALPSITITDFVGEIQLSNEQYATVEFSAFVDQKYGNYIRYWLSDSAYLEVLNNNPLRGVWDIVMNGGSWVDSRGVTQVLDGFTTASRYLVYSEWLPYMALPNSSTGTVSNLNENSTAQFANTRILSNTRYNKAINYIDDVYRFMAHNQIISNDVTSSNNVTSTFYDCFVDSTLYLFAGMEVVIDGVTYTVVSVNENVSFNIDAGATGLDFSGKNSTWQPFKGYDIQCKDLIPQW